MRSRVEYVVGRLLGVATRPLILFFSINNLAPKASQGLAVAFLATSLALVAIAADPHRRFYAKRFAAQPALGGVTFYVYVASVALLVVPGSLLVFAVALHFTDFAALAAAAVFYFLSEKLADELLRVRFFERDFQAWGRSMIRRSVFQLLIFAVFVVATNARVNAAPVVLSLALGNYIVFLPQLPAGVVRMASPRRLGRLGRLAQRAGVTLWENWLLWAVALASSSVGYLDRVVALVVDKESLALFTLVVMCFSAVQMFVDFFYLSRHRRDFLQLRISVGGALTSPDFLASLALGLGLAAAACFVALRLSRNGSDFPMLYVVVIAVLQSSVAVATVPREISYWTHHFRRILMIEVAFWLVFGSAAFAGWRWQVAPRTILGILAVCALLRLALHIALADRAAPRPVPMPIGD